MSKVTTKFGITIPTWGDDADTSTKANSWAQKAEDAWDALEAAIPGTTLTNNWTGTNTFIGATAGTGVIGIKVTGDAANRLQINASGSTTWGDGTASGDAVLTRISAGNLRCAGTITGNIAGLEVRNLDGTNALSHARFLVGAQGASAGDAMITYDILGVTTWTHGTDNSDSDAFKVAEGTALGSSDRLIVRTGGQVEIPGLLQANSLRATGDSGGTASTVTVSNANQGVSSGTGTVKMNSANPGNSTGWLKIYFGTTAKYIPVWDNPAP